MPINPTDLYLQIIEPVIKQDRKNQIADIVIESNVKIMQLLSKEKECVE